MKNRFFNFSSCEEGRKCLPLLFKRKSSLARFATMLLMLMTMSVGQMWADTYCSGASVKYFSGGGGDSWWQVSSTDKNLGSINSFYLKGFWMKLTGGNVCKDATMYYQIDGGASGNYNVSDPDSWSADPKHFQTESMNVNLLSGLEGGNYTLKIWFKGHGYNNCGEIWYSNNSQNYKMNFTYAKQYSITYKDKGGDSFSGVQASGYPTTHTYGTATNLKTATRDGYDFGGWYINSDCTGDAVTNLGADSYRSNITLYAKWTEKSHMVTYYYQLGGAAAQRIDDYTVGEVTPKTITAEERAGYTFHHWGYDASYIKNVVLTNDNKTISFTSATGNAGITAHYVAAAPASTTWYAQCSNRTSAVFTDNQDGTYTSEPLTLGTGDWTYFWLYDGSKTYNTGSNNNVNVVAGQDYVMAVRSYNGLQIANGTYTITVNPSANTFRINAYVAPAEPSISASLVNSEIENQTKFSININYSNIPSGYTYRVKVGAGYWNDQENRAFTPITGTGQTTFESYAVIGQGVYTVIVELWNAVPQETLYKSDAMTLNVVMPTPKYTGLSAIRTPEAAADAPTISAASVNQGGNVTVTAQNAKTGYVWSGWTSTAGTFVDASAQNTTFTPTANNAVAVANYIVDPSIVNSGWYLCGSAFGNEWGTNNKRFPFNKVYRGIEGIYYRQVENFQKDWFRLHDDSEQYVVNSSCADNTLITKGTTYSIISCNNRSGQTTTAYSNVWAVVNPDGSKFWIQDPATYYDVTVTGAKEHGDYTLVDNTTNGPVKGTACEKYSASDTYLLTVTPNAGYVPSVRVNGGEIIAMTDNQDGTYSYSATPTGATTLAVSYTRYFAVNYTSRPAGGLVSAKITSTETAVAAGSTVAEGTSVTFTAHEALNYKFAGWYGTSDFSDAKISDETSITVVVNAATSRYAKFVARTYTLVDNMTGSWQIPDMTPIDGTWTYTRNEVAAGTYKFAISTDNADINPNKLNNSDVEYSGETEGTTDFKFTLSRKSKVTIVYTPTTNTSGSLRVDSTGYYTLTWDFDGGETATPEEEYTHGDVLYGTSIVKPDDPTKSGFGFTAWSPAVAETMPAENVTYTAQWAALIPTIALDVNNLTPSLDETVTFTVNVTNYVGDAYICFGVTKDEVEYNGLVFTKTSAEGVNPVTFTSSMSEAGTYKVTATLHSADDCAASPLATSETKTITANENLSTGWYVKSEYDDWKRHELLKASGHAGESVGYYTYVVPANKIGSQYSFGPQQGEGTYFKNAGTYTRSNSGEEWTFSNSGNQCQFTPDVAGSYLFKVDYSNTSAPKVTITYPAAEANAYYIYLGQSYDLPAAYTWASVNGGLPIVGNTATGKALGDYIVTRTDAGGHSEDVHVYVYQYYVKHQWGYAGGGTQAETNAAWVWRPMTLVGGTLTYTGTISNENKGGNLCWDYTYDWTGVYQLDNDGTHNFHPGLDNDSEMGYWGNGAHQYEEGMPQATTGATTWKANWASGLEAGQVADFTFVPTTPYNGTEEPSISGGVYDKAVHEGENICTVTFGSRSYDMAGNYNDEWTGANAKGAVTTNLGSTSGLKVLKGTKATFMATPANGFLFMGWYAAADCSGEVVSENATYSVILSGESYELYAKFQQEPTFKLYFTSGSNYDMTDLGNGEFYVQITKYWGANEEFYVQFGTEEWMNARMNHCQGTKVSNPGAVGRPIVGFGDPGNFTLTVNITYYGEGQNIDICVNAESIKDFGWYLCGEAFGGSWDNQTSNRRYPFNKSYRNYSDQYYREVSFDAAEAKYFRVHNTTNQYSGNSEVDTEITAMGDKKNLVLDESKAFKYTPTKDKVYWFVVKTNDTKQFWIQESAHYVNVTNIRNGGDVESTYTLKTTDGHATTMYNNGELYVLRITPKAGLQPLVTVDGVAEELVANQDGSYTYSGSMKDKDQNVVIRYEALKPITIRVRNDAKDGGFAQSECTPLLQYKIGSGSWTKIETAATPMVGFQKWFTITLPEASPENVTIQFCAGKNGETWWNNDYDWSTQVELSSAVSEYCLSIDNYKEVNYKQMRLSTAECPEFNVELTVSGGEQVGAIATLKSAAKISEDETHKVNLNYYVSYDGAEYELINNSPLVGINKTQGYTITRAGTYKYKVVATFNDGTQTWEAEAVSKTYTIEAVTLVMTPSANYVAKNTSLTLTPEITGLASNVNVMYSYSFSAVGLSVVNAAVVPATINVGNVANGTYTIYTTLKMGDVAIASHACNIEVGNITVSLDYTPSADVMAGTQLTLTATTTGIAGDKTYSFSVKAATEAVPVTLATGQVSNSINYTVMSEDTYTFTVVVNDGVNTYKATDEVVVAAKDYYINYTSWDGYQKMNYCGNGVYTYYYAGATKYRTSTNTASINTQSNSTGAHNVTAIEHPSDDNIDAIFSYNTNRDELTIIPATTVMYRIKSETEHGTFYSNEVSANGKVSFYATPSATLTWQTYSKEHIQSWQDGAAVSMEGITEDNVYVADAKVGGSPALSNVEVYNGTYYIYSHMTSLHESEIANVKTDNYAKHKQFQAAMTKFENLSDAEFYNHYWVEWVDVQWGNNGSYTSISRDAYATVGNTINRSISNILPSYTMTVGTNLRYGYSPKTNHFSRAFLNGAGGTFLQMFGHNIYDSGDGNKAYSSPATALTLTDGSGWVYMAEVKCAKPAEMKLISNYTNNDATQTKYLLSADGSSATTRQLLGSTTTMAGKLKFQITYDYKTNRIVTGWIPGNDDIDGTVIVDADILFVRRDNVDVDQLTMHDENASISSLQRVMFVMEMDRDGVASGDQADYWISLPFDCRVSDIFGVEGFNDVWGLQGYNGEKRAQNGGGYNWYWLSQNDVLRRGQGYVLSFDKKIAPWKEIGGKAYLRLYFPSTEMGFTMSQSTVEPPVTYSKHEYTGGTEDQRRQHSNWRIIGPMGYTDVDMNAYHVDDEAAILGEAPNFYYEHDLNYYSGATGHYRATDASTSSYKAFYSYLVQFAGTINWSLYTKTEQEVSPMAQALRAQKEGERKFFRTTLDLHLNDINDREIDRAFVCLRKGATEGYDQNFDLAKMTDNGGSRISTISDGSEYVANALPVETDTVAMLIDVKADGFYSIALMDENSYVEPILWDAELGVKTPLNMNNYDVTLDRGTYANRFYLIFNSKKVEDTVTGIENVNIDELNLPKEDGVRKLMINGKLYLLREGTLYDAQGRVMKQ